MDQDKQITEDRWDPIKQFAITRKSIWKFIHFFWILFLVCLLVMGVMFVKNFLFPPAPANLNQPEIHVASGGSLQYTNVQQSEKKRPWYVPTPFVEIFGEIKTDEHRPAVGARTGCRWEF